MGHTPWQVSVVGQLGLVAGGDDAVLGAVGLQLIPPRGGVDAVDAAAPCVEVLQRRGLGLRSLAELGQTACGVSSHGLPARQHRGVHRGGQASLQLGPERADAWNLLGTLQHSAGALDDAHEARNDDPQVYSRASA